MFDLFIEKYNAHQEAQEKINTWVKGVMVELGNLTGFKATRKGNRITLKYDRRKVTVVEFLSIKDAKVLFDVRYDIWMQVDKPDLNDTLANIVFRFCRDKGVKP